MLPRLESKHIITLVCNSLSILFAVFLTWQVVFFKSKSGQTIQWSLQRKLRFIAVFSCVLGKSAHLFDYIVHALRDVGCSDTACQNYISDSYIGDNASVVYNVFIDAAFLFTCLTTLDRYYHIQMIRPGSASSKVFISGLVYLITLTLVVVVLTSCRTKQVQFAVSTLSSLILLGLTILWTLSLLGCDLVTNLSMISTTLKHHQHQEFHMQNRPPHVNSTKMKNYSHKLPYSAESKRAYKVSVYQDTLRKRLYIIYTAFICMDLIILGFFALSAFVPGFNYEATNLATCWTPVHIYITFKLLNIVYAALRKCRDTNFVSTQTAPYNLSSIEESIPSDLSKTEEKLVANSNGFTTMTQFMAQPTRTFLDFKKDNQVDSYFIDE